MQVNKVTEHYVYVCLFLRKEALPHLTSHQPVLRRAWSLVDRKPGAQGWGKDSPKVLLSLV